MSDQKKLINCSDSNPFKPVRYGTNERHRHLIDFQVQALITPDVGKQKMKLRNEHGRRVTPKKGERSWRVKLRINYKKK